MKSAWLMIALATASLGAAGRADGQAERVPLEKGLVFTTTSRSGLVSTSGAAPVADTEIVYAVAAADGDRVAFRFTVSPSDGAAETVLDRQLLTFDRSVRREDLRSASRLTILLSSTDPSLLPGQTFAGTSSAVLQALHESGRTAFVLGVNEPEEGLGALARLAGGVRPKDPAGSAAFVASSVSGMLTSMSVSRHYYRGTLERVGVEPFPVLINGRRTTVPALHVKGELKFTDRTIAPQIWWLDNADNPLTLKWTVAGIYETVTRIDRPLDGDAPARLADGLSGARCRAELSGVYFTTASAQVLDPSMPALERFAALLRQHGDWRVTVEGHTDDIGSAGYNLDLSARRAAAVREVLVRRFSVPPDRLQTNGYGLTRPVETNATDEGRAHNRRVEVSRPCAR